MKKILLFMLATTMLTIVSCGDSNSDNGGGTAIPNNFSNIGEALNILGTINGYGFSAVNDDVERHAYYYITISEYTKTHTKFDTNDTEDNNSHLLPLPIMTEGARTDTYTINDNGSLTLANGIVVSFSGIERKDISGQTLASNEIFSGQSVTFPAGSEVYIFKGEAPNIMKFRPLISDNNTPDMLFNETAIRAIAQQWDPARTPYNP